MRKLSSLASRAPIEVKTIPQRVHNHNKPKISRSSKSKPVENRGRDHVASSSGRLERKDSSFGSISTHKADNPVFERTVNSKPIDHLYLAEILSRKDWYLLLSHEVKAQRLTLNSQLVVSILQNQENALNSLRFYIWLSSVNASLSKDQAIRGALSNALYRKGPVLLSAELIRDIKNSGCRLTEDLVCVLISTWGRLGLAKYCSEVFEQLSYLGISPSTRLYNAVIDGLVKSNSLDLAYLKFQQMEVDNCMRDRFTYNILIHGVCKANVLDEALRLVKQMEGLGYLPNVFTYTILIDGYCNAKRVDEAFRLLERMMTRNVRPNDATYRSLINGVFRSLPPCEAFKSLFKWVSREPNLPKVVYDGIIYRLCSNSLSEQITVFLSTAFELGYFPDTSISNMVMTCLIKGSDLDEACQLFERFIKCGVKVDLSACLALVDALYRSRREEKGNLYIKWILKEGLIASVFSYNMLIDCFCKANMMEKAMETLDMMSSSHILPNLVTFNTLMSGYCKCRDVNKAREMLLMLLKHGFRPDAFSFSSIIDVLCQVNRITDAFDCFVEMEGWGISPNAVTYNSLIHSFCKAGDVARAMRLFRKMQIDQIQPDVYTFNALILKYCKVNKIGMAQRLLSRMLAMDLKPDNFTYIAFINTFCESGRLSEAKKLLYSMEANGCSPDAHTCHSVISSFIKAGRIHEAQDIWLKYKGRGIELQPMPVKSVTFVCDFDAEEIASSA